MGKSPGKWIKTVLFGKKSSKSNFSKDVTLDRKTSVISKAPSNDFDNDSMVISSPIPPVIHVDGERTDLVNSSSANLTSDTEVRLERAATVAQAAFRGYMARRAYLALKGIIRLQAQIRGRLVRRQAVATLSCMRAIVEFQAHARGRMVRLSGDGYHVLPKNSSRELVGKKRADLLGTSLRIEKLSTNAFGTWLVDSSNTVMPLSLKYDPVEPDSVQNWLNRWSASHFWEPLPLTKNIPDTKPKRKQTKLQPGETEPTRPNKSVRRVPAASLEGNLVNTSENKKPKSSNELGIAQPFEKVKDLNAEMTVLPQPPEEEHHHSVEPPSAEPDGKSETEPPMNVERNGNQKTRRKSFPVKHEHTESVLQTTPTLPSYMAATESAKAKLRAQAVAKAAENGFIRRHSMPSFTAKQTLQSPRVQKPLQVNAKGWTKSNKPQIYARDDKTLQTGWKR